MSNHNDAVMLAVLIVLGFLIQAWILQLLWNNVIVPVLNKNVGTLSYLQSAGLLLFLNLFLHGDSCVRYCKESMRS